MSAWKKMPAAADMGKGMPLFPTHTQKLYSIAFYKKI